MAEAVRRHPRPRPAPLDGGPVYDSAHPEVGLHHSLKRVVTSLPLVVLLVRRDLTARYRRSTLGVLWALLTPMLTVVVLWGVFQSVFPVSDLGVPYAVYLASGILVLTTAQQGVLHLGGSFQVYEPLLSRVHLPAEVLAAGAVGAIGFHIGLAALAVLGLQLLLGVGVPWTVVLVPVVLALLLSFSAGLGMLVAGFALRLPDVLHVVGVLLYLTGFLTPTFFPLSAVGEPARSVIAANPLTGYLLLVRSCLYEGHPGSPARWVVAVALGVCTLIAGTASYARSARRAVVIR